MFTRSDKDASGMQTSVNEPDLVKEGDSFEDLVDAPGKVALVVALRLEVGQEGDDGLGGQQMSLFAFNWNEIRL